MAITLGTIATIASIIMAIYPIADSIVRENNSSKIARKKKELDLVLNQYNVKLSDLKNELEKRGLRYDMLMSKLDYVSPVGQAKKVRDKAEQAYRKDVETINDNINKITKEQSDYSAIASKDINEEEGKGLTRTILNY